MIDVFENAYRADDDIIDDDEGFYNEDLNQLEQEDEDHIREKTLTEGEEAKQEKFTFDRFTDDLKNGK